MSVANQFATTPGPFVHEGLFYRDADEFVAGCLPFVEAGMAAGEPVLVAVPGPNLELLQQAVGPTGNGVRFADMTVAGRNPGRIIPWVLHAFIDSHPGGRVRIIGEPIWADRSAAEYPACVTHEALINAAFKTRTATILCPYDTSRLDPVWVADAARTHPILVEGGDRWLSDDWDGADPVVSEYNQPLPEPPVAAATLIFSNATAMREIRRFVAYHATLFGLAPDRIADLQIAVHEVASNTVVHLSEPGTLRTWQERGSIVCEVRDHGHIRDPLAGRLPPRPQDGNGRGLLMVNNVCDLVQIHTRPGGTTIRLHMKL